MQRDRLSITILGSGTSTGVPVIGCRCPVCLSDDPRNKRTRCSVVIHSGDHNILIDTSTDLRQQILREDIRHIDAVFYTHSHADHLHGIDDLRGFNLRTRAPIPLYGSQQTIEHIKTRFCYIFDKSEPTGYIPQLTLNPLEQAVTLSGMTITPIPMAHGWIKTFGYRCGPVAYLTDCNAIPDASMQQLQGLDLLILDGLRFTPHSTHFNIPEAIEAAQKIGARQTLLTHLSHEVDHAVHDRELPSGISLAFDGQKINLPLNGGGTHEH